MRIGIVDMHKSDNKIHTLIGAVKSLGLSPYVLNGANISEQELCRLIQQSPIKYWIFSGSQYHVTHEGKPHVPMDLLKTDKRLLCICYSMESVLIQLGVPIRERYIHRKEPFHLTIPSQYADHPLFEGIQNPMKGWRDHRWYFNHRDIHAPVKLLASYNGEAMIATYKNAVLVQHHPEKTADGRQFIRNWLDM